MILTKDKIISFASNNSSTDELFEERSEYKEKALANYIIKPIDSWSTQMLFGRVDYQGDTVVPKPNYLFPIGLEFDEEILLVPPVANAAREFFEFYDRKRLRRTKDSILYQIKPVTGFRDISERYKKVMNAHFFGFYQTNTKRVKNFEDFLDLFEEFLKTQATVVTFSSFISSKFSDPLCCGLMFEIDNKKYSRDYEKSVYLSDKNFNFYYDAALRFGFKIDKNVPWRLVADIKSPNFQKYLLGKKVVEENIFETYYDKAYLKDIEMLKKYLYAFYVNYVNSKKTCQKKEVKLDDVVQKYDDEFWLFRYFRLKTSERI